MSCEWRSRGKNIELFTYLSSFNPVKIGFHLPSWNTRFVSMSESVISFLKGLKSIDDLKDFLNSHKAEPYIPYQRKKEESRILLLKDTRPTSIVPGGGIVAAMTGAADTQDNGFWYEIRAWGWGLEGESWQVRSGFLTSFEALARVFWDDVYQDPEGNPYAVQLAVMDAMGHRTDEVYSFASAYRGLILPFKGEQRMVQPYSYSNIEFFPGSKKAIPGGLQLLRANVNYYKNKLSRLLDVAPADPGAYHMSADMTDAWARQMTVEYVDEKTGFWACPEGADNHAWDVSVYGLVAYDVLGVKYWARDEPEAPVEQSVERKSNKQQRGGKW
jgi:phage terminase large subunit GpA-like protein